MTKRQASQIATRHAMYYLDCEHQGGTVESGKEAITTLAKRIDLAIAEGQPTPSEDDDEVAGEWAERYAKALKRWGLIKENDIDRYVAGAYPYFSDAIKSALAKKAKGIPIPILRDGVAAHCICGDGETKDDCVACAVWRKIAALLDEARRLAKEG